MGKLKKYLLLLFMIENLCTKTTWLYQFTEPVFYTFLVLGVLMIFGGGISSKKTTGRFGWMFALSFIYIFDCFIVGVDFLNQENIIFMGAKIATFLIVITSLNNNYAFYERKGIYMYALVASVALVFGFVFPGSGHETVYDGEERAALGFVNSNSLAGSATIILAILLFEYRDKKMKWYIKALCALAVFATMASGSRASMVVMAIILFLRFRISAKMVLLAAAVVVAVLVVLPGLDINVAGVRRIKETVNGEIGTNRDDERRAAIFMIEERPLTGWGLVTENKGRAAQLTMMGSHNSYLDLAKTMGIPLAIIWFGIASSVIYQYMSNRKRYNLPFDFFCVYALCTLFKGFFEPMFAGVHEIECNMFFISLAVLSMRLYNAKHGIVKYKPTT